MNLAKIIQKQRRKLVERLNEKDEVFKEQHEQQSNLHAWHAHNDSVCLVCICDRYGSKHNGLVDLL